jgi:hypothetical protein
MQPAVELMEDLVESMVAVLGATEIHLAGLLREAKTALGRSPPEWDGMLVVRDLQLRVRRRGRVPGLHGSVRGRRRLWRGRRLPRRDSDVRGRDRAVLRAGVRR